MTVRIGWDEYEVALLIDAVESSKFITSKKSDALIEKIHTMTSAGQVENSGETTMLLIG